MQKHFSFFHLKKTWLCLNNYHITVINIIICGLASSIDRPDIKELNSMNILLIKTSESFKETGFLCFYCNVWQFGVAVGLNVDSSRLFCFTVFMSKVTFEELQAETEI